MTVTDGYDVGEVVALVKANCPCDGKDDEQIHYEVEEILKQMEDDGLLINRGCYGSGFGKPEYSCTGKLKRLIINEVMTE